MARPTTRKRTPVSERVVALRAALGYNQQQFAVMLGASITTVARWETSRPPSGKALVQLSRLAHDEGLFEFSWDFVNDLASELSLQDLRAASMGTVTVKSQKYGYLLLNFEGDESAAHVQAFCTAFIAATEGKEEEARRAKRILDAFVNAMRTEFEEPRT